MTDAFDWTAPEGDQTQDGERRYREQSEALALALMVDRQAALLLSAFSEHSSDHERIAACRRAFRSAARHIQGTKVRTVMLRDEAGDPVAVLGYLDVPATPDEIRRALGSL